MVVEQQGQHHDLSVTALPEIADDMLNTWKKPYRLSPAQA
jgi:hypothetical protein